MAAEMAAARLMGCIWSKNTIPPLRWLPTIAPRVKTALSKLFEAQRAARKYAHEVASGSAAHVFEVLAEGVEAARSQDDEDQRSLELESIAQILGQMTGPRAVDGLIDILGSEEHEARRAAGSMLEAMAFERFKEVALGIERALAELPKDHLALPELPYLLLEIPEPGVPKLVQRFLEHSNEEVVAAAIEVCVELGDASSIAKLARLEEDHRIVQLDDEEDPEHGDVSATLGELAKEARLMLEALEPEDGP